MSDARLYFQFVKEIGYPIYVSVDSEVFNADTIQFIQDFQFTKLDDKDVKVMREKLEKDNNARLLEISEASPAVVRQLDAPLETDMFGAETIIPNNGYKVYRYKGEALMMFSHTSKEWRIGVFDNFGTTANLQESRVIMNRFLSLALYKLGVVGFWGVPVDEGVVVLKQFESTGEAIFIDVYKNLLISFDGVKKIRSRFNMMRLDSTLRGRNITMSKEQLISFLTQHSTWFDYEGLTIPVRQLIQALANIAFGLIHPKESFKPRTELAP